MSYPDLLKQHQPHAIRNQKEADRLARIVDGFASDPDPDQTQFLALVSDLLQVWETRLRAQQEVEKWIQIEQAKKELEAAEI